MTDICYYSFRMDGGSEGKRNVISVRKDWGSGVEIYVIIVLGWTGVVGDGQMLLEFDNRWG